MSSHDPSIPDAGTVSDSHVPYDIEEHAIGHHDCSWDHPACRAHFRMLADRVIALAAPTTVLDVGCGPGLWVQALRERGVAAEGIDASESAIQSAHPEVRPSLLVHATPQPIDSRYDLIICSGVLEQMSPADAQVFIDNICAATDRLLFSSSPVGFDDPTHINTKPIPTWSSWLAERGFFRRTDVDVTFHNPWSVYFERASLSPQEIVRRYEEQYVALNAELVGKREALLKAHRRSSRLGADTPAVGAPDDDVLIARHAALVARDNVIGLEAQIATLRGQLQKTRERLATTRERLQQARASLKDVRGRLQTSEAEIEALRSSRRLRAARAMLYPLSRKPR